MSNMILIIGESGSGKTYSLRNLNPEETYIFSPQGKRLPFKGAQHNYTRRDKETNPNGNVILVDSIQKLQDCLKAVNLSEIKVKNIVIDDFQYYMVGYVMTKAMEKGYDKWNVIGKEVWDILKLLGNMREDLNCIVLNHLETEDGGFMHMKTVGKMIDRLIVPEGLFSVVLRTFQVDAINAEEKYKFETRNNGSSTAKLPSEILLPNIMPNDLQVVLDACDDYYKTIYKTMDEDVPQ